jgi:hypothetical protein
MPALLPHAIAFAPLAARCATRGHRPGSGHGPAADAAGRGLRTGLGTSPPSSRHTSWSGSTAGLGLNSLADARSPCASGVALGVKIGGVLRGVLPRSLARLRRVRPAGFGWGRARRCGTRQPAASPTPPPIRARATPSLTRVVQIRLTADFQRRLSVRAFQGHFPVKIGRSGAKNAPRAAISPKNRPPKALQGRLQLAPSVPLRVKLGATCLTAAYLPGADSGPRPAPSRPRGRVRDWGQAFGLPRHGLSIL